MEPGNWGFALLAAACVLSRVCSLPLLPRPRTTLLRSSFPRSPIPLGEVPTTFFTPFLGREYIVFTVPLMDLGSRDIESSTSASMESTGRTHGSVIPPYFFYQIYLRLTSHALVPLLPSSWFPLWFSLFRALLSSRADHKRHSK